MEMGRRQPAIELVAIDMDGTLLDPAHKLTPRVKQAIARARAQGVRIFIGSENKLFSLSGSSVIASPYRDREGRVVGVLGVIGPTRLNYARVVPMVDLTARSLGKLIA